MKSKRGAVILHIIVISLFVLIIGVFAYMGTSNKQALQLATLNKLKDKYNNSDKTTEDIYQEYNKGDIVPIFTPEQFSLIGSGQEEYIEQTGQFYVFGTDKTYLFYGVPDDLEYYISQLTNEIKENVKIEVGASFGEIECTCEKGILTLKKSTNILTTALTITATASTEDGIQTYVPPTGVEKLYERGTTEITEQYEITKNGIYTFSVVDQNGNVSDATIQITNIVSDGIGMVVSTTEWTKDDVILTITWPTASEKGRKEVKIGNGEWTRYTGASTVLNISENATIEARVTDSTSGTETRKTNQVIVGNIDKAEPVLAATDGVLNILEGDSYDVANLFEYDKNGIAPITVQYTLYGEEIANINELEPNANAYEIKCTVTKANGYEVSAIKNVKVNYETGGDATEIASKPKIYYGRTVSNYECESDAVTEWQIFNSDGEYIYLISKDYIQQETDVPAGRKGALIYRESSDDGLFFTNIVADYDGCSNILDESITDKRLRKWVDWEVNHPDDVSNSSKSTAYILDNNVWSIFKDDTYAEYAIGGPTVQMIVDSYNQRQTDDENKMVLEIDDAIGYVVKTTWGSESYDSWYGSGFEMDLLYWDYNKLDSVYGAYWLAGYCQSDYLRAIGMIGYGNGISFWQVFYTYQRYGDRGTSFRPVICLDSSVELESNGDGTYMIKWKNNT